MNIILQKLNSFSTILLLIIGAGTTMYCTSQQKSIQSTNVNNELPEWVTNPSKAFSERTYLMAVGSGDNLADARADAMLNLAQIFRSQIDGTQNLYTEFSETTRNKTDFTSKETIRLMNNIRIGASEELMNTEVLISEIGNDGSYYVLAGMNRSASLLLYEQEIGNNYQRINNNKNALANDLSTIQKLSLSKENVLLARVNVNLYQQLAIISPENSDQDKAIDVLDAVNMEFSMFQENSVIQITMNKENLIIKDAVTSVFQKEGFVIGNRNPVLKIDVSYTAEEAHLNREDADFVTWDLSIQIHDLESGKAYNTFSQRGRDGALSMNDAYKKSEFSATKEIKSNFSRFLINEVLTK